MINTVSGLPEDQNSGANTPPSSVSEQVLLDEKGIRQVSHPGFIMSGAKDGGGNFGYMYRELEEFLKKLDNRTKEFNSKKEPGLSEAINNAPVEIQEYIKQLEKSVMTSHLRGNPIHKLNNTIADVNSFLGEINASYPGLLDEIGKYPTPWNIVGYEYDTLHLTLQQGANTFYLIVDIKKGLIEMGIFEKNGVGRTNEIHIPLNEWQKLKGKDLRNRYNEFFREYTREKVAHVQDDKKEN